MPLTFGVPFGLVILIAGIILHFVTRSKMLARIMIGLGALITAVTLVLILLVVYSDM